MVLHDFVERITEDGHRREDPARRAEISTASRKCRTLPVRVFRRPAYSASATAWSARNYTHNKIFDLTTIDLLFTFTGLSGIIDGELGGQPTLPSNWIIDWRRYHEVPQSRRRGEFPASNFSRKIDPRLSPVLQQLPGGGGKPAVSVT